MTIHFNHRAYLKLKYFVELAPGEISGFGKTYLFGESVQVDDIVLLPQTVSAASTTIEEGAVSDFLQDLIQRDENPAHWNLWWHSHGRMGAFWSGTDTQTIGEMEMPWTVSVVASGKGDQGNLDLLCRIDIFEPERLTFDKLPWEFLVDDGSILDFCKAAVEKNVKEVAFKAPWKKGKKKKGSKGKKTLCGRSNSSNQLPLSGREELEAGQDYILPSSDVPKSPSLTETRSKNTTYLPNSSLKGMLDELR